MNIFLKISIASIGDAMLNVLIGALILISIVSSLFLKTTSELSSAMLEAGKSAVNLTLSLIGTMALWQGILRLSDKCGFSKFISKLLNPILKLLFPKLKKDSEEFSLISMNITANMLGVSNASTSFGLKAAKLLKKDDLELFVLINCASFQIIPTTCATLRKEYGSAEPFSIIFAVIIISLLSEIFSVLLYKAIK